VATAWSGATISSESTIEAYDRVNPLNSSSGGERRYDAVMRIALLLAALTAALIAACAQAASSTTRHTRERAERNLLSATRMLARWHAGLTDPRTGLLLRNTTARCAGQGVPVAGAYPRFLCTLRHGTRTVHVRYYAQARGGFEVRRLA
jgi:hypothetical protein